MNDIILFLTYESRCDRFINGTITDVETSESFSMEILDFEIYNLSYNRICRTDLKN